MRCKLGTELYLHERRTEKENEGKKRQLRVRQLNFPRAHNHLTCLGMIFFLNLVLHYNHDFQRVHANLNGGWQIFWQNDVEMQEKKYSEWLNPFDDVRFYYLKSCIMSKNTLFQTFIAIFIHFPGIKIECCWITCKNMLSI